MKILITGGAGFIGSAVVRRAIADGHDVVNLDALTYSANLENVVEVAGRPGYAFEQADVCDAPRLTEIFARHRPDAVMHLAAESHNDRAIEGPLDFVRANVTGTAVLLEAARGYWGALPAERQAAFRFHHVSTDEVFGALGEDGDFTEATPYDPNSPYSASKAAADHLGLEPVGAFYQPLSANDARRRGLIVDDADPGLDAVPTDRKPAEDVRATLDAVLELAAAAGADARRGALEPRPETCSGRGCVYPQLCRCEAAA